MHSGLSIIRNTVNKKKAFTHTGLSHVGSVSTHRASFSEWVSRDFNMEMIMTHGLHGSTSQNMS